MNTNNDQLNNLLQIIDQLRGENGCPWDKKQTTDSLRTYLIEEAHELHDALDSQNAEHIKEELGDMLFIVAFLAHLFKEKGMFTLDDSLKAINTKMVRRHPHVFDSSVDLTEEEQRASWLKIKEGEKTEKGPAGENVFSSTPRSLPALRRAQRISEKARHEGIASKDNKHFETELQSALENFPRNSSDQEDRNMLPEKIGKLLYLLADYSQQQRINPEEALHNYIDAMINQLFSNESE